MATLNTRIKLKHDTLANWTTNNPVLLAGEVAITEVPSATGSVVDAPAILMKVGDGTNQYNDLPFLSAAAADVHDWAKASVKPTYAASEITGLDDYIAGEIEDTDTQYQIVKVDDYNYKLQSKALNGEWADVTGSTIVIPEFDPSELEADIATNTATGATNTAAIATLNGGVTDPGSVAKSIADAIAALNLSATYESKGSAATVQSDLDAYKTSNNTAVGTAQSAANAAQSAANAAQADVDALETKVGTVTAGKTVVEMISDAQTAATYDDTALKGRVTTVEGKVTTLEGSVATLNGDATAAGSVAKALADAKAYADGLAGNYDAAGLAAQALVDAKAYTDEAESDANDYTDAQITARIASTYKAAGSVAFASLGALIAANEGKVYNVSDAFTTTSDFVEGAGSTYPAGTNVVIIKVDSSYKYDVLAGMTDLSAYSTTTQVEGLISTAKSEAIAAAATDATTKADTALTSAKDYTDTLEDELATIAKTGNVDDLIQTAGTHIVFDCGTSSTVI